MIKIENREELNIYLDRVNFEVGIYMLIKTDDIIEDIYIWKCIFEDNTTSYFESSNILMKINEDTK